MTLRYSFLKLGFAAGLLAVAAPLWAQGQRNDREFAAFQIINERNIFDPTRRPRRAEPPVNRQPEIVDVFALVGTMSYSNQVLAFFDGSSSDYRKALKAGDRIATYTLKDISPGAVKLESGTNDVSLKVGMQMRRMGDGSWRAADATYGGVASYSNNRGGRDDRGNRRFSGFRGTAAASMGGGPSADSATRTPDLSNLDPSDPVARLMLRRLQEEGGVPPAMAAPQQGMSQGMPLQMEPGMQQGGQPGMQRAVQPGMMAPATQQGSPVYANGGQDGGARESFSMPPNQETNQTEDPSSMNGDGSTGQPEGGQELRN